MKDYNPFPALERRIGCRFRDAGLLKAAFVHTSYVNEHRGEKLEPNERLEFLGDAVLELVATEFLYGKFPRASEGKLTTFRSALVKGKHLAQVARFLGLGEYLFLSRGEEKGGGRDKNFILANTIEALIGAIHLDRGFAAAHKFVSKFILTNLEDILEKGLHVDAKSRFQELSQERFGITPRYLIRSESGPDHSKEFEVGAYLGEELISQGKGKSKQKAEEDAAQAALRAKVWE